MKCGAMLGAAGVLFALTGCRRTPPPPTPAPIVSGPPIVRPKLPVVVAPKFPIGTVVKLAAGALLSNKPYGVMFRRAGGSPALVLESPVVEPDNEYVRVLAADGTSGWIRRPGATLGTATVAWDHAIDSWFYAPEDKRFVEEGASTIAPNAGPLSSASTMPWATSVQAMRVTGAEFLEQPLLSVRGVHVHPLTVTLRFPVTVDPHLRAPGFAGVIRPPFLGAYSLSSLAPRVGEMTNVLDAKGEFRPAPAPMHHWNRTHALVLDRAAKPGSIEALAVVGDGGAVAFALSPRTRGASFVLPRGEIDSPWLGRCEIADLDDDGKPEWLIEIVTRTSHGVSSKLVVIAGTSISSSFSARVFHLADTGDGDGPPAYAFWVDDEVAFLARDKVERLAWPAGTLSPATPEVSGIFESPDDARSSAAAGTLYAFPIIENSYVRWALGRAK